MWYASLIHWHLGISFEISQSGLRDCYFSLSINLLIIFRLRIHFLFEPQNKDIQFTIISNNNKSIISFYFGQIWLWRWKNLNVYLCSHLIYWIVSENTTRHWPLMENHWTSIAFQRHLIRINSCSSLEVSVVIDWANIQKPCAFDWMVHRAC